MPSRGVPCVSRGCHPSPWGSHGLGVPAGRKELLLIICLFQSRCSGFLALRVDKYVYVNKALGQGAGNESSCSRNAGRKRGLGRGRRETEQGCTEQSQGGVNRKTTRLLPVQPWGEEGARMVCWLCAARAAASPRAEAWVVCGGPALHCRIHPCRIHPRGRALAASCYPQKPRAEAGQDFCNQAERVRVGFVVFIFIFFLWKKC